MIWLNVAWSMLKNAQKFDWKLTASTHRDAFSEIFELEAQGQLLQQQKDKRRKKMKKRNKKNETPKNMGHFLVQRCQILISAHAQKKML